MENYQLDKSVWTESDFEVMGWHDSYIYAFKVDQDIYFDIDYIFKWVQPEQDDWFSFWVAPCTLVFDAPRKFSFQLENNEFYNYIEVADMRRKQNEKGNNEWHIETHIGNIIIETEKFTQFVRRPPTFQIGQQILPEERGEVSFDIKFDKNFVETLQVKQVKQKDLLLRQKAMEVKHLRSELSDMFNKRQEGTLGLKEYLLRKRSVEQKIKNLVEELKRDDAEFLANPNF